MAVAALDVGYAADTVCDAAWGGLHSWSGDESLYWDSWRKAWEEFLHSDNPRVREIARLGLERATLRRDRSRQQEEASRIYGD